MILAALAGGVLNLAFPPLQWWWAAILAVAVLHLSFVQQKAGRTFLLGTVFGLAFFLPLLWWSTISVGNYIPWLALSIAQALVLGLYGLLRSGAIRGGWFTLGYSGVIDALGSAVLFVALEAVRSRAPFGGFAWGLLGYSQIEGPLSRLAAYGGTTLVGFVVVVAGVLLARTIDVAGERGNVFLWRGIQIAAVALLPLLASLAPLSSRAEQGHMTVGLVQGNVPRPPLATFAEQARKVTDNHRDETLRMLEQHDDIDLIVWPESAADLDPRVDAHAARSVTQAVQAAGVPIMVGTQEFFEHSRVNQHVVFVPEGESIAVHSSYTKQHPVPFGEYIPYRDFFAKISSDVEKVQVDMVAGNKPGILDVPIGNRGVRLGDAICFEISVEDIVRESVELGAKVLIVPTNNASFGDSQEAAQQTAITRFRAIEHGRSAVQASTVGISAIIDPRGRVIDSTELWTAHHLVAKIPLRESLTVADRLGIAPVLASGALALGWVLSGIISGGMRARRRHYSDV